MFDQYKLVEIKDKPNYLIHPRSQGLWSILEKTLSKFTQLVQHSYKYKYKGSKGFNDLNKYFTKQNSMRCSWNGSKPFLFFFWELTDGKIVCVLRKDLREKSVFLIINIYQEIRERDLEDKDEENCFQGILTKNGFMIFVVMFFNVL